MAAVVSYDNVKKGVVALLLASNTAYGAGTTGNAPDGSVRSLPSSEEFNGRILEVDAEVCTAIAMTMQHPFQTTFVQTTTALSGPSINLPARNGIILSIQTMTGKETTTFTSADIPFPSLGNIIVENHGLVTGQKVQLTTTGALPANLSLATNYWIIRVSSDTFRIAATQWNAQIGTPVTFGDGGSGTQTITSQYQEGTLANSKDTVTTAFYNASVYTQSESGACGFWFIEGDTLYVTSPKAKVVYTDFVKTSSPQAPEPYEFALIAGTVAKLLKDGGDAQQAQYYEGQYGQYMQSIVGGAMVLPAIAAYK